jgi:hypothetical protein
MKDSTQILCPFKKKVASEYNPNTGKRTMYEKFEVCAGERCMAYRITPTGVTCRRLQTTEVIR